MVKSRPESSTSHWASLVYGIHGQCKAYRDHQSPADTRNQPSDLTQSNTERSAKDHPAVGTAIDRSAKSCCATATEPPLLSTSKASGKGYTGL